MKALEHVMIASVMHGLFMLALGGTAGAELPTYTTAFFAGSGTCASCHNNLKDINKKNVGIIKDEVGSMMGNAFVDPLWRAKVRSEVARNPHLTEVIVKKCTTCHAPMASVEMASDKKKIELFTKTPLAVDNPKSDYAEMAKEGISCTLCHQIKDTPDLGTLKSFSGHFTIDKYDKPEERPSYGPFKDVNVEVMVNAVQYTPVYGAHMETSNVCGTCHNLLTPYVDAKGNVLSKEDNEFPEQMALTEWRLGSFSTEGAARPGATPKTCQECHMPPTTGVKISSLPAKLPVRDKFFQHTFFSGNLLLLDILSNNADALEIDPKPLKAQIEANQDYLASAVEVQLVEPSLKDGVLDARVKVVNKTGHKLPTGIPFRRIVVHFTVTDENGNVVFESGKINSNRSVSGCEMDGDNAGFEAHYDLITKPDQVQIYEAVMGDSDGKQTFTLLRALKYLKDNRIVPQGFDIQAAPEAVRPTRDAQSDKSFQGGSDVVAYQVKGLSGNHYTVAAALEYQTVSFGFLKDLYRDADLPEVKLVKTMIEHSPVTHSTMATATAEVRKL